MYVRTLLISHRLNMRLATKIMTAQNRISRDFVASVGSTFVRGIEGQRRVWVDEIVAQVISGDIRHGFFIRNVSVRNYPVHGCSEGGFLKTYACILEKYVWKVELVRGDAAVVRGFAALLLGNDGKYCRLRGNFSFKAIRLPVLCLQDWEMTSTCIIPRSVPNHSNIAR